MKKVIAIIIFHQPLFIFYHILESINRIKIISVKKKGLHFLTNTAKYSEIIISIKSFTE